MIISRTPFRISFFGGGTDYPVWYQENGGSVIGTTIDKYCYITCRCLPPFFEHKYRIVYSQSELVRVIDDIHHPAAREVLRYADIDQGVEIHHDGDLPARTGLGSSSAFTVGLLHALYALKGIMPSKMQLAREAIHIEQDIIEENVGCQDQMFAAYGGLNRFEFCSDGDIEVKPITIGQKRLSELQNHLMMFYTGLSRTASDIAGEQIKQTPNKKNELSEMMGLVDEAIKILTGKGDLNDFGRLLDANWQLKRSLTDKISNPYTDFLYETAIKHGATGGKLLGAGGGGFILLFVKPELQKNVREGLNGILNVPFRFEGAGSQIIFYEPDAYYNK
jgi:D-glycero-alpha-D-manno-heptose-7-phosphate kinase